MDTEHLLIEHLTGRLLSLVQSIGSGLGLSGVLIIFFGELSISIFFPNDNCIILCAICVYSFLLKDSSSVKIFLNPGL